MMKRTHWAFVLGGTLAATAGMARPAAAASPDPASRNPQSGTATADSRIVQFDIPAGPLEGAVREFERLTGITVTLANRALGTIQTAGVAGSMTPARALDALLRGTSIRATLTADGVTLDIRAVAEIVTVEGQQRRAELPKYTEPILDTPQTLVAIPQEVFLEQNATSLREVLRNTPGITMSIGEGGSGGTSSGDNVLVRGFSARSDIYVDGVRDPGLVNRDMFNTESVEVAKGPTSVTGGRGATGGSLNLVTKSATLTDAATFRVSGGSADYKRTALDVNRKVTDSMAVRLNAMWQDTGYPGRDVARYRSWGIAPSVGFGLNTGTKIALNYSRMKQDNIPDWGLPTLLPDVAIAQGVTVNDLDFHNFYGIASRDYEKTTSDVASAVVTHQFTSTLTLRNLTRYGKNYRDAVLTAPRPASGTAGQGPGDPGYDPAVAQIRRTDTKFQHRDDRIAANQTDLSAEFVTGPIGHSADIGLEVARDRQPTYAFVDLFTNGRPPVDDLFHPTPYVTYSPALARTGAATDAHARTTALYAFDTVKLSERWRGDFGLRWDHISVDYDNTAVGGALTRFGRTDRAVTGRAGVVFKPAEKGSIYAAVSTSFAPSFDGTLGLTLAATGANSQALAPERSRNVEAGTKWELAHDVMFTAAVFQMQKTNAKTVDLNGATVLAGDQRVNGVELGLMGEITEQWSTFTGISFMDGTVKASGIASEVGAELPYVPHISFNFWSTYRLNRLTVGGGVNYNDGHYFNQTGGFLLVGGGSAPQTRYVANAAAVQALTQYWTGNAMASYAFTRHLSLQVNATNLADTKYADRAYDRHFLPGPGRQVVFSPVITF